MPPGTGANWFGTRFASTTNRSNKRAKAFVSCLSSCPPKAPGSTPSSRSGCMRRRRWLNLMACSRPSSWLNAFVRILAAPTNHIWLLSKRSRDYALGDKAEEIDEATEKSDILYYQFGSGWGCFWLCIVHLLPVMACYPERGY